MGRIPLSSTLPPVDELKNPLQLFVYALLSDTVVSAAKKENSFDTFRATDDTFESILQILKTVSLTVEEEIRIV